MLLMVHLVIKEIRLVVYFSTNLLYLLQYLYNMCNDPDLQNTLLGFVKKFTLYSIYIFFMVNTISKPLLFIFQQ